MTRPTITEPKPSSEVELKPCPFCGGDDVKVHGPYGWYRQWGITHSCKTFYSGAQELAQGFNTKAAAIAAWNTRSPQSQELALLREALEQDALWLETQSRVAELGTEGARDEGEFDGYAQQSEKMRSVASHIRTALNQSPVATKGEGETTCPVERLTHYPDYVDDPAGLERLRECVLKSRDRHNLAPVNYNSLARLIDTIERLRAASPTLSSATDEDAVERAARLFVCRVYDHLGKGRIGHQTAWEEMYERFKDQLAPMVRDALSPSPKPVLIGEGQRSGAQPSGSGDSHVSNI